MLRSGAWKCHAGGALSRRAARVSWLFLRASHIWCTFKFLFAIVIVETSFAFLLLFVFFFLNLISDNILVDIRPAMNETIITDATNTTILVMNNLWILLDPMQFIYYIDIRKFEYLADPVHALRNYETRAECIRLGENLNSHYFWVLFAIYFRLLAQEKKYGAMHIFELVSFILILYKYNFECIGHCRFPGLRTDLCTVLFFTLPRHLNLFGCQRIAGIPR